MARPSISGSERLHTNERAPPPSCRTLPSTGVSGNICRGNREPQFTWEDGDMKVSYEKLDKNQGYKGGIWHLWEKRCVLDTAVWPRVPRELLSSGHSLDSWVVQLPVTTNLASPRNSAVLRETMAPISCRLASCHLVGGGGGRGAGPGHSSVYTWQIEGSFAFYGERGRAGIPVLIVHGAPCLQKEHIHKGAS